MRFQDFQIINMIKMFSVDTISLTLQQDSCVTIPLSVDSYHDREDEGGGRGLDHPEGCQRQELDTSE